MGDDLDLGATREGGAVSNTTERKPAPPAVAADDWVTPPWPLPEPMTAAQYQREAIASATSTMPDNEVEL